MDILVTFVCVFGTSLLERLIFEEAQAMQELSELVEAAQSGDREAYDTLIQRFQQMAYTTAYRYLRDHHLAQDLVQEASIEAFVHLPQLKEPGAFPGWFRQIVFRQCTRVLRQVTPQYTSLEAVRDGLLAESNPEEIAVQGEVQACVRSAVASLPQHERLVTVLFYGCRYSYNEVSTLLKIPLATVKKRLYSARQKLKVQLQASLHDTIENARRASDEAEGVEICLARWWSWLMRCVREAGRSPGSVLQPLMPSWALLSSFAALRIRELSSERSFAALRMTPLREAKG